MLEVKNLSKIYKPTVRGGVETKALDNVSLTFPETGMVFLLGKSGSGKSTLLNVCGGLDSPTSGEIIVKGKSSKSFSQSDFDSYRNTFIGFIFQEYNILNEFSIEDNIALALELQGKPKDKKAIAALLDEVDLSGFAKRKPNTLSGGQKQRIAIARALVKSPEIIMADEPTGALDSNTGKQVFDTLKKLSRNKLVIVVSHDRDFAELYGDRIIELKDGKILSDVTKEEQKQAPLTESITATGGILCVKSGAKLDDNDMRQIKSFLEASEGEVIIAKDESDISAFKKAARITDTGAKEYFASTDESKLELKQYKPEDSKFIRSRLPLRHAIKIGVSGLKTKPFRLFMTIVLCTVAFILFGLLSTLTFYNSESMFKQTLSSVGQEYVTLNKTYQTNIESYSHGVLEHEYTQSNPAFFSEDEIQELRKTFGDDIFGATEIPNFEIAIRSKPAAYWNNSITTIAYLPEGNAFRDRIEGAYPANDDEICISSYTAETLMNCKAIDDNGEVIEVSSISELIGRTVKLSGYSYKIVGIFKCDDLDSKFDTLKETTDIDYSLSSSLAQELEDGAYLMAFLTKNKLDEIASTYSSVYGVQSNFTLSFANIILPNEEEDDKGLNNSLEEYPNFYYQSIDSLPSSRIHYFNQNSSGLADNEALISDIQFVHSISWMNDSFNEELYDMTIQYQTGFRSTYDPETGEEISREILTAKERADILSKLLKEFSSLELYVELTPADQNHTAITDPTTYKVAGIYTVSSSSDGFVYLAQNEYDKLWSIQFPTLDYCDISSTTYVLDPNASYSTIYAPFSDSEAQKELLWQTYSNTEYEADSTKLSVGGSYVDLLETVDFLVKQLLNIFFYVGLVFALFAILLFSNFITTSITQKRREIGILRAVGARSLDVFKIFFSESFVIAFICSAISTVLSALICNAINTAMATEFSFAIFVFGPFSILVIIGVALLTAILATFIPVWIAARKKPVDSIKSI